MLDRFSLHFWTYLALSVNLSHNSCHQKRPQKKDTCLCQVIVMYLLINDLIDRKTNFYSVYF